MDKLEFSIASEIGNIVKVENFIDYFSDVYNVEPDVFGKISLCVIEAVNNAILYGINWILQSMLSFRFTKKKSVYSWP